MAAAAWWWWPGRTPSSPLLDAARSIPDAAAPPDARSTAPPPPPPARDAAAPPADGAPADRESAIREKIDGLLAAYPNIAHLTLVHCDPGLCRVELEATDLDQAGPLLERLEEPGTGFATEFRQMKLTAPTRLDAGPYRLSFTLEY